MNARTLTMAEVEDAIVDAIVDAIEVISPNYQCFPWEPVTAALKHLKAVATARTEGKPAPSKPSKQWGRMGEEAKQRSRAYADSQMMLDPQSVKRPNDPVAEITVLHVWTSDGCVVGFWNHTDPEWIEAKRKQIMPLGEGYGWVVDMATFERAR